MPIGIRIQSGSRAVMTKNWKKIYSWTKLNFCGSKTTINQSPDFHKRRPSYKISLQHFETWSFLIFFYFCESFLPFCIRIQIFLNPIRQFGSGSETLKNLANYSIDIFKAVNREDKRSRRYRDDISRNLKGLVAIEIANAVRKKSLAGVETAIRFFETQPCREREPDR